MAQAAKEIQASVIDDEGVGHHLSHDGLGEDDFELLRTVAQGINHMRSCEEYSINKNKQKLEVGKLLVSKCYQNTVWENNRKQVKVVQDEVSQQTCQTLATLSYLTLRMRKLRLRFIPSVKGNP